mgnify:CR=1 FL=1
MTRYGFKSAALGFAAITSDSLFVQMIGRYLTDDEVKEQSDAFLQGNDRISSILIQHIESKGSNILVIHCQ